MSRKIRILRNMINDAGRRATYMDRGAETLARRVELPTYAWPGGYEVMYLAGGEYPVCQPCAQNDLERNGTWPDGYEYVAGGAVDYGGRDAIRCVRCGDGIATFNGE